MFFLKTANFQKRSYNIEHEPLVKGKLLQKSAVSNRNRGRRAPSRVNWRQFGRGLEKGAPTQKAWH